MAIADLNAFIIERLQQVDNTLDLTPGSPYDVQVIQPILQRLGTDPFTVDIGLFIQTLLNQNFPDMPTKEGDAITDLLIKGAIILWNPIVREISRVSNSLSFRYPNILTTDEADALGANLFATRETGQFSKVVVRSYFAMPQGVSVSPANFITTKEGLHFFPTEVQSIRVEEMLLNLEGTLYFFDINTIAEQAGNQYNIPADDVVTIANVASATRITNKLAAAQGLPAEDAVTFIGRAEQELTERSLVTQAGIVAKITGDFPDVMRLNIAGFNDPEMQRDIITGGGLGPILAAGVSMFSEADGETRILTRRVITSDTGVDFTALIGPTGSSGKGYTLTVAGAYPLFSVPTVRDLTVRTVIDTRTLDLDQQVLAYAAGPCVWTLRQQSLSLSGIPGGILYPNQPDGTVTVPNNQVHIGGCTDVFVRAAAFDSDSLVISSIVDDRPLLSGVDLGFEHIVPPFPTDQVVQLLDLVMGVAGGYTLGDSTWTALNDAATYGYTLQILDPPNAGSYRILEVVQANGSSPVLVISPAFTFVPGSFRWRISSSIFIDLVEPKETKISGSDLRTVQGQNVVTTTSGVDFSDYGVGQNDVLRITSGLLIVGDYVVRQVLSPLFTHLQVDRNLPATVNDAKYYIFWANPAGGIDLPFVRIDSIDLLDTSGQPVGSIIPYANPIDVESRGFANSAHGIKVDLDDGILGIVTLPFPSAGVAIAPGADHLSIEWQGQAAFDVPLTDGLTTMPSLAGQINVAAVAATAGAITRLAVVLNIGTSASRVGLLPVAPNVTVRAAVANNAMTTLFGFGDKDITSKDIRSGDASIGASQIDAVGGWDALRPRLDTVIDVAQVLDGLQIGFYDGITVPNSPFNSADYDPLRTGHDFSPEVDRHIQVGSRSLGIARLYFLDPTSFEVDDSTVFTYTDSTGAQLRYIPDPTNAYQRIPALPNGTEPEDGMANGSLAPPNNSYFTSASTDFIAEGIQTGDQLVIDYIPFAGSVVLSDPVVGLNAKVLTLSIGGGVDKSIVFVRDSGSIPSTDVSRQGVVNQINSIVGQTICSLDATNHLQFQADTQIIVRGSSVSNSANPLLGFSLVPGVDQNNNSHIKGTYIIQEVAPAGDVNQVIIETVFASTADDGLTIQQFKVFRAGLQRIVSTTMATQVELANLYYFDVELLSQGTGDQYNITANLQMTVTGFRSDGYYLTTDNPNLTFSPVELPKLHMSRSILEVGTSDSPANATQLPGQNIQLNYDRSSLTANVDNFIRSDTERVINESPLGRHLIPYFVRFTMTYSGGSTENILIPDLQTYIQSLYPTDTLNVSNLEKLADNRGARSVDNPIDLIAVIHNFDRTITVERSQSALNTGTLAAFIPDVLLVKRRIA